MRVRAPVGGAERYEFGVSCHGHQSIPENPADKSKGLRKKRIAGPERWR